MAVFSIKIKNKDTIAVRKEFLNSEECLSVVAELLGVDINKVTKMQVDEIIYAVGLRNVVTMVKEHKFKQRDQIVKAVASGMMNEDTKKELGDKYAKYWDGERSENQKFKTEDGQEVVVIDGEYMQDGSLDDAEAFEKNYKEEMALSKENTRSKPNDVEMKYLRKNQQMMDKLVEHQANITAGKRMGLDG